MSVGLLTGRPAEEMPGLTGDLLPELLQLHKRVRQAMQGVIQAMWPSVSMPEGLGELANKLEGVRQEKNNLQDANTQLGEELKDVRVQLSYSVKENLRLRRSIYSKCLNELLETRVRRGSRLTRICL